jgi:GntR family transcriptional regulator
MREYALYHEIYQKLLAAIKNGEYAENAPLPSERHLCEKYHVSRSTIRQAIQLLKEASAVYSVQGNGTFVKPQVFLQPLTNFYSFTDTLKSSNILIQNEIVQYEQIPADWEMVHKTGYAQGAEFHKIVRLRSAKEYPLMLETTYLPCARFLKLDLNVLSHGSLYEYLKKNYNFHADSARETLRPIMPQPSEKALLKMPANTPCILLERFSYEDGLLIEYTSSVVRGDKYIFHADLSQFGTP